MTTVLYQVVDRVAYITLNRPDKRNALNEELISDLSAAFDQASRDTQVGVIVLKGQGDVFCSGADLAYLQKLQSFSFEENLADSKRLKDLFAKVYSLEKVVIAQVEGAAIAGGCGLATICDFVFAVPEAKFGYTEVKIGFIPAIVMVFLIRKIGDQRARQLLLSGSLISADDALALGLVTRIFTKATIAKEIEEFASKLVSSNSAQAMATTKKMLASVSSMPLDEALSYAARMNAEARASDDCQKGIAAFLEKRPLTW